MVRLAVAEVELLKKIYVRFDTPVDRFIAEREKLVRLVHEFNSHVTDSFAPDELLGFMMTQRKRGLWPRIRRQFRGRNLKRASERAAIGRVRKTQFRT